MVPPYINQERASRALKADPQVTKVSQTSTLVPLYSTQLYVAMRFDGNACYPELESYPSDKMFDERHG